MSKTIKDGMVVSLAYRMSVEGVEIETIDADDPLDYLHGAENIVPGLEEELTGKQVGDKFTITLQPEDAYGVYDDTDTEVIDRIDLPDDLEEGMEIYLEDEDGNVMEAFIKEVTDNAVVLDFNDPLAGKTITWDVEVLKVRGADKQELEHGHPHSDDYLFDD